MFVLKSGNFPPTLYQATVQFKQMLTWNKLADDRVQQWTSGLINDKFLEWLRGQKHLFYFI
jgi:hypothetical protein